MPEIGEKTISTFNRFSNAVHVESPLFIGFVIHICWSFFIFTEIFSQSQIATDPIEYSIFGIVSLITFFLTCLAVGIAREYITLKLRFKRVHFIIALCNVVGCLLFLSLTSLPFPLFFATVSALLCGSSYSIITVLWGEASRRRSFVRLALLTCCTLIVAIIVSPLAVTFVDANILHVIICIVPLISVVSVYKAQHDNVSYLKPQEFIVMPDGARRAKEGSLWEETYHDLKISKLRFALKLGRPAFFFGLPFGYFMLESFFYLREGSHALGYYIPVLFSLTAVLAFFILFATFNPVELANPSRKLFSFFLVFALLALGGVSASDPFASGHETLALLVLFASILWLYPAELSHRYRISALLTFGFSSGFLSFGVFVSFLYYAGVAYFALPWYVVALLNLACALIGFLLLITDEQMKSISLIEKSSVKHASPSAESGPGGFTLRC